MSLIAEVVIPQMFTAFAQDLGYSQYNGLHHKQYYCKNCGQSFSAAWGIKPGCFWRSEYGNVFRCPRCGVEHSKHVVIASNEEELPDKVRLTVKEYQDVVTLEVNCKTVYFTGVLLPRTGRYKEVFRFDTKKQSVLFYRNSNEVDREAVEIGSPFDISLFEKSILWYFQPISLAVKNHKKELNRILRVLRETVHRKMEKHQKHKISSMFVNPGTEHGTFLLPLLNIAYRVSCPDAPNLPSIYRESKEVIVRFWDSKIFSQEDFETLKTNMAEVIKLNRKRGNNFVSSMIQVFKLPDTPFIRKAIHEEPFNVMILSRAFQLCRNYDNACRMYKGLLNILTVRQGINNNILWFLQEMKPL